MQDTVIKYKKAQDVYQSELRKVAEQIVLKDVANITKGRYTSVVSDDATSPTIRMANLTQLLQVEQLRPGTVPIDMIIDGTDLANKEELISRIKEQQQLMAQAQQSATQHPPVQMQ
jgi:hypothetical protein